MITAVAISEDASFMISASKDKTVKVWEVQEKTTILKIKTLKNVCFAESGKISESQR